MPIPRNIDRLVKLNDQIAQSEAYRADITKANKVAQWHEKTLQRSLRTQPPADYKIGFRDNQLDELRDAVSIGLEGRRARLRDLLLQDASLYEGELGLKGLAIYKEVV